MPFIISVLLPVKYSYPTALVFGAGLEKWGPKYVSKQKTLDGKKMQVTFRTAPQG